ncbi:MAG: MOSC domain-containing protein [Candidatus Nanopelagicales bacterium]
MASDARVRSVNLGVPRTNPADDRLSTGIDKRPTTEPVHVRAPGPQHGGLGSGLVGDHIGNHRVHGGDDAAVYAYAREDLDRWEQVLGRPLPDGAFGENLTTEGVDVTGARVGEQWAVGDELVLQVTEPRVPCNTFRTWMDEAGWLKTFTAAGVPGAYLRVVTPGTVRAGDAVRLVRPREHDVTIGLVFRAVMGERDLLPGLLEAGDDLTDHLRDRATDAAG